MRPSHRECKTSQLWMWKSPFARPSSYQFCFWFIKNTDFEFLFDHWNQITKTIEVIFSVLSFKSKYQLYQVHHHLQLFIIILNVFITNVYDLHRWTTRLNTIFDQWILTTVKFSAYRTKSKSIINIDTTYTQFWEFRSICDYKQNFKQNWSHSWKEILKSNWWMKMITHHQRMETKIRRCQDFRL